MAYRVFAPLTSQGRVSKPQQSSLSLSLLFRVSFTPEPPLLLGLLPAFHHKSTSLAVSTPSTFSRFQAATQPGSNQPPVVALAAFLTLTGPCRPEPAGLVSCQSRPWGSTLQGSSHSRSRTPFRTPLPSCGWPSSRFPRQPRCPFRSSRR